MFDLLKERREQEERLRNAGFFVDGGGMGIAGGWDIFVYLTTDPNETSTILSSVEEVDEFIEEQRA